MQLTKYEHVCLDLTQRGRRLIVDPGIYSQSLQDFQNICAVVITHIHPDHYSPATIQEITKANPDVQIFTTKEAAKDLAPLTAQAVSTEKPYSAGPFKLEFFGGQHASISPNYPAAQNYGVLINDTLYYPGDSLVSCPKPHGTLALPIMAPWLKFSQTADFLANDSARLIIPTHNGFINQDGQTLYDRLVSGVTQTTDKTYRFLAPGESINL